MATKTRRHRTTLEHMGICGGLFLIGSGINSLGGHDAGWLGGIVMGIGFGYLWWRWE